MTSRFVMRLPATKAISKKSRKDMRTNKASAKKRIGFAREINDCSLVKPYNKAVVLYRRGWAPHVSSEFFVSQRLNPDYLGTSCRPTFRGVL